MPQQPFPSPPVRTSDPDEEGPQEREEDAENNGRRRRQNGISPGRCVFTLFGILAVLQVAAPAPAWHGWRGVLLAAAGLAMTLWPARVRLTWPLWILSGLVAAGAGMAFLPADWFPQPLWRQTLEASGLSLGDQVTAHPVQAGWGLAPMALGLLVILFLLGHRADHGMNHLLALVFAAGVGVTALFSISAQEFRWVVPWDGVETFGPFPNRNHMATLLVMGVMTGLGVAVQSLRVRTWRSGLLALTAVMLCVWALIAYSVSRAGIILLGLMFAFWLLMLGRKYLRGRVLVAAVLLAGGVLYVYNGRESVVKGRLDRLSDHISYVAGGEAENEAEFKAREADSLESLDLRLPIFSDTVDMLKAGPWSGVGAGQFRYVFPQYRTRSSIVNGAQAVHPENDWLFFAAENGLPAAGAYAALILVIGWMAVRETMDGRARALRAGCLMAAATVPVHGLVDVPGHRVELVWAAIWLVALTLRRENARPARLPERLFFRAGGVAVVLAAVFLIRAQWFGGPAPLPLRLKGTLDEVGNLVAQAGEDYKAALAEEAAGTSGEQLELPEPPAALLPGAETPPDRLEQAIGLVDEALRITPMDAHLHTLKGALSVHFDDREAETDRAFATARLLDPAWVELPLRQAAAWAQYDQSRIPELWAEALRRSYAMLQLNASARPAPRVVLGRMMRACQDDLDLIPAALSAALPHPGLLEEWAGAAPVRQLNDLMPELLNAEVPEAVRHALWEIWHERGDKKKAGAHAEQFPGSSRPDAAGSR